MYSPSGQSIFFFDFLSLMILSGNLSFILTVSITVTFVTHHDVILNSRK